LQQDNDPTHGKASAAALAQWHGSGNPGVQLLPGWPPNSPDLSPIENVWGWAQQKVDALGCSNFDEFTAAVEKTLRNVPNSMIQNLFASIPKRLGDCLALEGQKTTY